MLRPCESTAAIRLATATASCLGDNFSNQLSGMMICSRLWESNNPASESRVCMVNDHHWLRLNSPLA